MSNRIEEHTRLLELSQDIQRDIDDEEWLIKNGKTEEIREKARKLKREYERDLRRVDKARKDIGID